jgi:WD40 repeat protein
MWDPQSGTAEDIFDGDRVTSLALGEDGRLLAVSAESAQLLDPLADNSLDAVDRPVVLPGHKESVTEVAFSADGGWLATGSEDDTARLWLPLKDVIDLACVTAGRNLTEEEWNSYVPGQPYERTCELWPSGNGSGTAGS